nr:MAG TPA: hypothetical protein [Bacteriophage sp.]
MRTSARKPFGSRQASARYNSQKREGPALSFGPEQLNSGGVPRLPAVPADRLILFVRNLGNGVQQQLQFSAQLLRLRRQGAVRTAQRCQFPPGVPLPVRAEPPGFRIPDAVPDLLITQFVPVAHCAQRLS